MKHEVTAVPVEKLRDGIVGYRFACSCGRTGNGWHNTPEQAITRGHDHIRGPLIRMEFEFHEDTCNADLTRLTKALNALEAMGVIVRQTQLGLTPEEAEQWPR